MLYIAENLKKLRKEKDLTQEEVAEMLDVSAQSVSKWERGDTMPDITLLPTLANLYKVSVDALIGMDKIIGWQACNNVGDKVHHTTRAALCFIYMKTGEKEKSFEVARRLPHVGESRENILAQLEKNMSVDEIDSCLKSFYWGRASKTRKTHAKELR